MKRTPFLQEKTQHPCERGRKIETEKEPLRSGQEKSPLAHQPGFLRLEKHRFFLERRQRPICRTISCSRLVSDLVVVVLNIVVAFGCQHVGECVRRSRLMHTKAVGPYIRIRICHGACAHMVILDTRLTSAILDTGRELRGD